MREFESTFEEGLRKGLRQENVTPAGNQQLIACRNLRPSEFGLKPVESMTNPFALTTSWPFPQMLLGRETRIVATEDSIYECDSSWSPTLKLSGLTVGGLWQFADAGTYILGTNGQQMVMRNSAGVWSSFASTSSIPGMDTVCFFKGQIFGGAVNTAWEDCDSNYVLWSDIGSAEFYPGLRIYTGGTKQHAPKNESGYSPLGWNGSVLRMLPLGDMVVVYGTNGISYLRPAGQYIGIIDLDLPGIPSAGCACGSDRGHLFVDYAGDLWMINNQGQSQRLGFEEFITNLDASEIVISYNDQQSEYYISDSETCYVLTRSGLCQTHQIVSSVCFDNGSLYGTYESDGNTQALVTTDNLDFGLRAFKTLGTLQLGCSSVSAMATSVYWRANVQGNFSQLGWQVVNPTGFTTPMATAHDFRISFRSADYSDTELRYIKARLKLSDKRAIRGIYSAS